MDSMSNLVLRKDRRGNGQGLDVREFRYGISYRSRNGMTGPDGYLEVQYQSVIFYVTDPPGLQLRQYLVNK